MNISCFRWLLAENWVGRLGKYLFSLPIIYFHENTPNSSGHGEVPVECLLCFCSFAMHFCLVCVAFAFSRQHAMPTHKLERNGWVDLYIVFACLQTTPTEMAGSSFTLHCLFANHKHLSFIIIHFTVCFLKNIASLFICSPLIKRSLSI